MYGFALISAQDITLAATLQRKSKKYCINNKSKKTSGQPRVPGPPGSCFSCAQTPNVCPRRKKDKHWTKDCRSKTDLQGKPLPPVSENWVRGQPQAPKQGYGAIQNPPT